MGYSALNRIGSIMNDGEVDLTYEGDNTVLLQEVSRNLLVQLSKGRMELGAKSPKEENEEKVSELTFIRSVLVWRQSWLLEQLQEAMSKGLAEGQALGWVWNLNLNIAIDLGRAFSELHVFDCSVRAIQGADEQIQWVMSLVSRLFGVSTIERHLGQLISNECVSRTQAKRLLSEVRRLCDEIHPFVMDLLEAYEIPDHVLNVPIAKEQTFKEFFSWDNRHATDCK